ncbi:MBL fold metallo-hydrolase [Metabacillus arenae]|nr:MBL fold metallo-hydrolase [Metabacillus arenae]
MPFRIMMLGVGNGFSKKTYNNNALLESKGAYFLIDCGVTAWSSLADINMDFENISGIFLTHLHYDHCGGLDEAALYGAYVAGRKLKLWVPAPLKPVLWEQTLRGRLEDPAGGNTRLEHFFEIHWVKEREIFSLNGLSAYWLQTEHVPSRFSCSLVLDGRFFYSGDMVENKLLIERLIREGINVFYHDVQFKHAVVHASFKGLLSYPEAVRKQLYLMHYSELPAGWNPNDLNGMNLLRQHEWLSW